MHSTSDYSEHIASFRSNYLFIFKIGINMEWNAISLTNHLRNIKTRFELFVKIYTSVSTYTPWLSLRYSFLLHLKTRFYKIYKIIIKALSIFFECYVYLRIL